MKLTTQKWLFILIALVLTLAAGLGWSTYRVHQEKERANALEISVKVYENEMKALIEKNFASIDSLEDLKADLREQVSGRDKTIRDMLLYIDSIINKLPENEKAIDNMRDSDSIHQLFTRYYPGN